MSGPPNYPSFGPMSIPEKPLRALPIHHRQVDNWYNIFHWADRTSPNKFLPCSILTWLICVYLYATDVSPLKNLEVATPNHPGMTPMQVAMWWSRAVYNSMKLPLCAYCKNKTLQIFYILTFRSTLLGLCLLLNVQFLHLSVSSPSAFAPSYIS